MWTQLDPWESGAAEIAARKVIRPRSVGLAQAHSLTKTPAMSKLPSAVVGPVTAYPTHVRALVFGIFGFKEMYNTTNTCEIKDFIEPRIIFHCKRVDTPIARAAGCASGLHSGRARRSVGQLFLEKST